MPELPEVEVTRLGLLPTTGARIASVTVRHHGLRWPIPHDLADHLVGKTLLNLTRRAKYILADIGEAATPNSASTSSAISGTVDGTLLLHLGMSGRLCLLERFFPPEKHDHVDIAMTDGRVIRFRDPRRFGAVLWLTGEVAQHPLLAALGPEPLSAAFTGAYLQQAIQSRQAAIKPTIMDGQVVVGVGNIYASESLFRAGIHPETPAKQLSKAQCQRLVAEIKTTLEAALAAGGSSLRDFFGADGNPGYFQQTYHVYGRTGEPCLVCQQEIQCIRLGQRSTFYCPRCQKRPVLKA